MATTPDRLPQHFASARRLARRTYRLRASCFSTILPENMQGARSRGLTAVHVTSPNDVADALAALGI